jgi:hypothetical protein
MTTKAWTIYKLAESDGGRNWWMMAKRMRIDLAHSNSERRHSARGISRSSRASIAAT